MAFYGCTWFVLCLKHLTTNLNHCPLGPGRPRRLRIQTFRNCVQSVYVNKQKQLAKINHYSLKQKHSTSRKVATLEVIYNVSGQHDPSSENSRFLFKEPNYNRYFNCKFLKRQSNHHFATKGRSPFRHVWFQGYSVFCENLFL